MLRKSKFQFGYYTRNVISLTTSSKTAFTLYSFCPLSTSSVRLIETGMLALSLGKPLYILDDHVSLLLCLLFVLSHYLDTTGGGVSITDRGSGQICTEYLYPRTGACNGFCRAPHGVTVCFNVLSLGLFSMSDAMRCDAMWWGRQKGRFLPGGRTRVHLGS